MSANGLQGNMSPPQSLPPLVLRFADFGLALDVPITYVNVGNPKADVPLLKPTDFYQHLADIGKWDILYGKQDASLLPLFWQRFAEVEPNNTIHDAFESGVLDPCRTIPLVLHGDEGRGKKRRPVMIVNTHSLIGAGCRSYAAWHEEAPELRKASMGVNLKGSSMETRFLAFVLPKSGYGKDSIYLHAMFDELVDDLVKLQTVGVTVGAHRWHLAVIGAVGDLQFFTKLCSLTRSYNHVAKRSGQEANKGICHLCMGGTPGVSFEDFTDRPGWYSTQGLVDPWETTPKLIRRLHVDVCNKAGYLKPDIWHCMHMGAGKNFVSSAVVELLPRLPGHPNRKMLSFFWGSPY